MAAWLEEKFFDGVIPRRRLKNFHSMLAISFVERSDGRAGTITMSESIRGIIHVHSYFSSDGLHSVADLAEFGRQSGFQFVGLTDHAEDLTSEDMRELRLQCEKYSDDSCVMIPGLEFRCHDDIHILGLGFTGDVLSSDAVTVATEIGARGGLAILAHPIRNGYKCPQELFGVLGGIEIWNAAYDGRFVPRLASLRVLQEARNVNPSMFGIGGADLHGLHSVPGVVIQLAVNRNAGVDSRMVLQDLQSGRFSVCGRYVRFDAHTEPHPVARFLLWTFRKLYEVAKRIQNVAVGEM